jgi:transcriptional regulator with XRE-family HTH domain
MQRLAARFCTLADVLDKAQIVKDLIDFRGSTKMSIAEFEELAKLKRGRIQRIESGQHTIELDTLDGCLRAVNTTLAIYFGQIAMLKDLKILNEDETIIENFKRVLKVPAKRESLKLYLESLVRDLLPAGKARPKRRGKRGGPSGGQNA